MKNRLLRLVSAAKALRPHHRIFAIMAAAAITATAQAQDTTTVGAEDNSTEYDAAFSDMYVVGANETLHLEFVNYSDKAENWHNWAAVVSNAGEETFTEYFRLRADAYGSGDYYAAGSLTSNFNWDTFKDDMDGANVVLELSRSGSTITLNADITTVAGATYNEKFVVDIDGATENIGLMLTTEKGHLVIDNTKFSITSGEATTTSVSLTVEGNGSVTLTVIEVTGGPGENYLAQPGSPVEVQLTEGQTVQLTMMPDGEATLMDLTVNGASVLGDVDDNTYYLQDTSIDQQVVATFSGTTASSHTITVSSYGGGYVMESNSGTQVRDADTPFTVDDGTSVTFTFVPDEGYYVQSAIVGDSLDITTDAQSGIYTFDTVGSDETLFVQFARFTLPLTVTNNGQGSTHIDVVEDSLTTRQVEVAAAATMTLQDDEGIPQGAKLVFTFQPETGYQLTDLRQDTTSVLAQVDDNSYTIASYDFDQTITATYEAIPVVYHTLTLTAGNNGSIVYINNNGDSIRVQGGVQQSFEVAEGTQVPLRFVPSEGYYIGKAMMGVTTQTDITSQIDSHGYYVTEAMTEPTAVSATFYYEWTEGQRQQLMAARDSLTLQLTQADNLLAATDRPWNKSQLQQVRDSVSTSAEGLLTVIDSAGNVVSPDSFDATTAQQIVITTYSLASTLQQAQTTFVNTNQPYVTLVATIAEAEAALSNEAYALHDRTELEQALTAAQQLVAAATDVPQTDEFTTANQQLAAAITAFVQAPDLYTYTVHYVNGRAWTQVYAYTWISGDTGIAEPSGAWPGTQLTQKRDTIVNGQTYELYTYSLTAAQAPANIIFSDGGSNQTADLSFMQGHTYLDDIPQEFTMSFVNAPGWESVYAYTWRFGDTFVEYSGAFPGVELTERTDTVVAGQTYGLYTYRLLGFEQPANIIFSNGQQGGMDYQTPDLEFQNGQTAVAYRLGVTSAGSGTVALDSVDMLVEPGYFGRIFNAADSHTLRFTPAEHYRIDTLTVNGADYLPYLTADQTGGNTQSLTLNFDANQIVYVHFGRTMHTLTLNATEHGSITYDSLTVRNGERQVLVADGAAISVTVLADDDCYVALLTDNGTDVLSQLTESGTYTIASVTGDITLAATFAENDVTPYAVLSDSSTVLTFYYDRKREERGGLSVGPFANEGYVPWSSARESITSVVFDDSFSDYTSLTSTAFWFCGMSNLATITGLEKLNTVNVTDMNNMFVSLPNLTSLDVSSFNTANVTNMSRMFAGCSGLTTLDLNSFNTANVTSMDRMFYDCTSLTSLDLSSFNTANVTTMYCMFFNCPSLTSLNLSSFNTGNVTNMNGMFYRCSSLPSIDVSLFNTERVTDMQSMFQNCTGLTTLDLSSFNTANMSSMELMFSDCPNLTTIFAGDAWTTNNVTSAPEGYSVFSGCTALVGGEGTAYDANHTDHTYARIDGGAEAPGYFTAQGDTIVHTVHIVADGNGTVAVGEQTIRNGETEQTMKNGRSSTLIIQPDTHYYVDQLTVNGDDRLSELADTTFTLTSISAATSVYVHFAQIMHTLTVSVSEHGALVGFNEETGDSVRLTNTEIQFSVGEGAVIPMQAVPDAGYHLGALTINGADAMSSVDNDGKFVLPEMTGDVTVVATFGQSFLPFSVATYGKGVAVFNGTVIRDTTTTFQIPEGSTAKVYVKADPYNAIEEVFIVDVADGAGVYYDLENDLVNDTVTIENITESLRVEVNFEPLTVPLTITSEGQGTVRAQGSGVVLLGEPGTYETTVEAGSSSTYVFRPAEHYYIDSLSVNGVSRLSDLNYVSESGDYHLTLESITDTTSVYVRFAQIMHTLTLNASEHGSIAYDSVSVVDGQRQFSVADGSPVSLTIAADAGYHLGGVTNNGEDVTAQIDSLGRYTFNITDDVTVAAVFEQTFHELVITAYGNGAAYFNGSEVRAVTSTFQVEEGSTALIAVKADEYNHLDWVTVNNVAAQVVNDTLVISNITSLNSVEIVFAENSAGLAITSEGSGTVYVDQTAVLTEAGSYNADVTAGSSVQLTFTPAEHYYIDSLSVNGEDRIADLYTSAASATTVSGQVLDLFIEELASVYVRFALIQHTLTLNATEHGSIAYDSISVVGGQRQFSVAEGTTVSLTIAADAGYHLGGVTNNGEDVTAQLDSLGRYSFTMSDDVTVAAVFGQTFHQLAITANGNGKAVYNGTELRNDTGNFQVEEGSTARIAVKADPYNRVSSVLVNGTDAEVVDDTLTIADITADVQVEVVFEQIMHNLTLRSWGYGTTVADSLSLTGNRDGDVELRNERRMEERSLAVAEGSVLTLTLLPEQEYHVQHVLAISDNTTDTIAASRMEVDSTGYRLQTDSLLADMTIVVSYVWTTDSTLINEIMEQTLDVRRMADMVAVETERFPWYRDRTREIITVVYAQAEQLADDLERNSTDEGPDSSDPMPSRPVVENLAGLALDCRQQLEATYSEYMAVNEPYARLVDLIDVARAVLADEQYIHSEPEPLEYAINMADSLVQHTGEEPQTDEFNAMIAELQAAIDEFQVPRYQLLLSTNGYGTVAYDTVATRQQAERWLRQDTQLTLTFTPDEGYHLSNVTVNGAERMADVRNNSLALGGMRENVAVEAVFEQNSAGYELFAVDGVTYRLNSSLADESRVTAIAMTDRVHADIAEQVYYDGRYWQVVAVGDTLFNQAPSLVSVSLPASIEHLESNAFANNLRLSAIDWQGSTALTLEGVSNANLLVYVQDAALAPEGVRNVVVGDVAEEIVLSDDRHSSGGFHVIRPFVARNISYTHNYTLTTPIDGCQGWETLSLPFDVETITHATKGEIEPFARGNAGAKHFWLYSLGAAGFEREADIRAYVPYVISMPNNRAYKEEMRLNGRVTFAAQNAQIEPGEGQAQQFGNVTLTASMMYMQSANNIFALNISGEMEQPAGSVFGAGIRDIRPFQAYATYEGGNAPMMIPLQQLFDGEDTGIDQIIASDVLADSADGLYDLGGRKVTAEKAAAGQLSKGVYVRNGRKQVIK